MNASYYDVLRWIYENLPTDKTSIRWKIARFYAERINPKDYDYFLNVGECHIQYSRSKYIAFRRTFYYFAGLFEEKEAGQHVMLPFLRDKDLYPYMQK